MRGTQTDIVTERMSAGFHDMKWVTITQEPSPLLMKVSDDQSSYMETESVKDTEGDTASEILSASVEEVTPVPEKPTKKVCSS